MGTVCCEDEGMHWVDRNAGCGFGVDGEEVGGCRCGKVVDDDLELAREAVFGWVGGCACCY